ncbi:hypothetical protein RRG08_031897 [Elysia crispata]|uniref:Uncharacterized protein n=1 Tax=Elysia crispata TaxID=231223 RepID=A0AAE1DYF7_9GAST|nr:hypothetical protein RRG08_031897 [Elysia crispata]
MHLVASHLVSPSLLYLGAVNALDKIGKGKVVGENLVGRRGVSEIQK